jgi:chromosome partitioning protein
MKGGVGKTTISGNVFRELFRGLSKSVLLIDFDSQFNLTQLLITRSIYEILSSEGRTISKILHPDTPNSVFAVSEEYLVEVPDPSACTFRLRSLSQKTHLDLVPGSFDLAMLNLREPARQKLHARRFGAFMESARLKYDLIVLDCNPSSSFATRCAIDASTHILVPVKPDKYSALGVEMVWRYTEDLRPYDTPVRTIVFNDFNGTADAIAIESEIRSHRHFGPNVLVNIIKHSGLLTASRDYTGFAVDRKVPYKRAVRDMLFDVASEYADKLGIDHD